MIGNQDEKRETPFGPLTQEDVISSEYTRSLEGLKRFANLDLVGICNLEDLSTKASLVSHDILTVVLAKGEIQETRFEYRKPRAAEDTQVIDRTYVIRKPVSDYEVVALGDEDHVNIDAYKITNGSQISEFMVRLPANKDIGNLMGDQIIDESGLHAVDWRFGVVHSYYPSSRPDDIEVNRGFAKVLQDGVKDLLTVLP